MVNENGLWSGSVLGVTRSCVVDFVHNIISSSSHLAYYVDILLAEILWDSGLLHRGWVVSIGSDLSTAKPMVGHRFISLVDVSRCAYEYLLLFYWNVLFLVYFVFPLPIKSVIQCKMLNSNVLNIINSSFRVISISILSGEVKSITLICAILAWLLLHFILEGSI